MSFIGDFHIHGRYAGACSKDITLTQLEKFAKVKGIGILGTGDFTHPGWYKEVRETLKEDEQGILWSKTGFPFLWQTEISLIYTQGGKGRRIHLVVLAPHQGIVDQITETLKKRGRVDYDGRPIFGMSCIQFVEEMMSISKDIEIIPGHCMTPWFGLYGSKSGFDSLKECFEEKEKYIHAVETGMSADPPMLWRFSHLEDKTLVSFSDNHSFWPWRLGREATIFDCKLTYKDIVHAIRTRDGLAGTIEVIPSYGKYHWSGHRACGVSFSPEETRKAKGICPKCKKPLTIGVEDRVEEIADKPEGHKPKNALPYYDLIPLTELISSVHNVKLLSSKKVWEVYHRLIDEFKTEYHVLLDVPASDLKKVVDEKLTHAILAMRSGSLKVKPGYDGVYGVPHFSGKQKGLNDF